MAITGDRFPTSIRRWSASSFQDATSVSLAETHSLSSQAIRFDSGMADQPREGHKS